MTARRGRMLVFVAVFLLALCLPAHAGMLFADGVEVDGADNREEVNGDGDMEDAPESPEGRGGPYDPLPMFFADMDQYEQIAMEPYRDKYDTMPVAEKARVYGSQFAFMHDREPNFDPAVAETVRKSATETLSAYEAKQFLYKPATPKPPRPTEAEQAGDVLKGLPGPWEANRPPEAKDPQEGRQRQQADDRRMETLRQGWSARDVLRGRRER